ncbi:putative Ring-box protein [Histomonas meleagridis]|uniref:putative Ring-box protein n=1 Tax=Histomonas meleagridis TaxID=135588 RepID=UPI00355994C1|nr:putative Ring-box protein [Histomonas meleagridis]KAH0797949.1 putative Ring-box protein [Histomonas meleagridis]
MSDKPEPEAPAPATTRGRGASARGRGQATRGGGVRGRIATPRARGAARPAAAPPHEAEEKKQEAQETTTKETPTEKPSEESAPTSAPETSAPHPTRSRAGRAGARPGARPAGRPGAAGTDQPRLVLRKFNPVYISSFKNETVDCSFCRMPLHGPCADDTALGLTDPCPTQEGKCGHIFHIHCLDKWIKTMSNCPLCSSRWVPKD